MTDKFEEIVDNLKQPSHWLRLPFMVAFGFVLYLIFVPIVIVIMVAQILFALITGSSNRNLRGLGSVVQQYVSQIVAYITYNSSERPFPFSDFPVEDPAVESEATDESTDERTDSSKASAKETSTSSTDTKSDGDGSTPAKPVKKAKKSAPKAKESSVAAAGSDAPSISKKAVKKKAPAKKKASTATVEAKPDSDSSDSAQIDPTEEESGISN